jgi:hypothetical protein
MQKVLVCNVFLPYNQAMPETTNTADIARIEDLSPADLQDWIDWQNGIQK